MVAEVVLPNPQADHSALRVPTYDRLMWPTLKALRAMGGSATNEELLSKIIEQEAVPPEIAAVQHVDQSQSGLNYNLAWAKTYLKKVGAVENSGRAVWAITKIGEGLNEADIAAIPSRVRRQDADVRRLRDQNSEGEPAPADSGDAETALEPFWKDELLATLRGMTATAFERLAQRLLRESGFIRVEVTGRSGDGGIDGIGVLRLTLLSFQVLFQCKRYQGSVGASAIRDFRGAMVGRSDKGLMITTGTFTSEAKKEATRDGAPPIDLIDGDQLCDLLKSLKPGVRTELVERMVVDKAWFAQL
jgi:restriction system protein